MSTDHHGLSDPMAEPESVPGAAGAQDSAAVPRTGASRLIDLTGSAGHAVVSADLQSAGRAGDGDGASGSPDPADLDTRQRIIQAAASVFREKGFTGTRVVDIARRAGYTSGALYGYFDSRAELLAEAIAAASSAMLEGLLGTLDPAAEVDPLAVLDALLAALAEPLGESDQMLLDGVAIAHREPVAALRLTEALGRFRSELQGPGDADDGTSGLSEGAADVLVILLLGITAARALGLHDPVPVAIRDHLADCLLTDRS